MEASAPTPSRSWRELPGTTTALVLTAVALLTVGYGLLAKAAGVNLGVPLPPFFAHWEPQVDPAAIVAIPLFALAVAAAVRLARAEVGAGAFVVAIFAVTLLARLSVSAARDGTEGFSAMFGSSPEAANEYLPALPALHSLGLHDFLDRFAEISPTLPIHPSAHPPGTLLLLDALGIDTAEGMAWLVILVGALAVPLTYWLARGLGVADDRSRAAALLLALSPSALLYGVTSTDSLFATLGMVSACLLVGSGVLRRIAGALALAAAAFFSWALLALGAFAVVATAVKDGLRSALALALVAGVVLVAVYAALYAATGFDPVGAIRAAGEAYDLGISNARPYLYWLFGSPVAFAVALGLPTAWYAARALGTANAAAVGLAAIIIVSVLVGLTKAETERIWLFMGPPAAVAAASMVPLRRMPLILGLLAAQALACSLLLFTIW
ncbi:MAG: hypothetical protein M9964_09160 [Solirubrobacterales bacterium]|nr:hypothetical protein [Solirubrobacterales bacterium]